MKFKPVWMATGVMLVTMATPALAQLDSRATRSPDPAAQAEQRRQDLQNRLDNQRRAAEERRKTQQQRADERMEAAEQRRKEMEQEALRRREALTR
ncbi:hypothetical protein A6D6_02962 [Alcanivorax xiamenensis]|uniref:Uncharacterized protein n=1 Tax=Alcanivorax xiamenensis TaxID=1177156 RepID=A0ABQ6Y5P1_9GAMM|nr:MULTISPECIES: hypothetical protein [Alcanivorax]KAF0804596.1 hypothetical protein A6D6_02962 [Alcanivorax xiamenensis]